jgi:two-component system sensor histidine kinase RegB
MAIATLWLKVPLPLMPMMVVVGLLVVINVASLAVLKRRAAIAKLELFAALMLDVAALTAQLYLSGGATNPFISLFLLQVVLGSVLLNRALSWVVVAATSLCFAVLLAFYVPLPLPLSALGGRPSLHTYGLWLAFVMVAVLLVLFVTRISENLRARDAYLADMRRQAVEADHIVRIGLLASGAAHELGTPLSSLSVILNDWRREPHICEDPQRLGSSMKCRRRWRAANPF